jgi:hypothetical protein
MKKNESLPMINKEQGREEDVLIPKGKGSMHQVQQNLSIEKLEQLMDRNRERSSKQANKKYVHRKHY